MQKKYLTQFITHSLKRKKGGKKKLGKAGIEGNFLHLVKGMFFFFPGHTLWLVGF